MSLARKIASAATMLRRKGWGETADLTRLRAAELYRAHRRVSTDPVLVARMVSAVLNRRSFVSSIALLPEQMVGVRATVLRSYIRHRFAEAAVQAQAGDELHPVEVVIRADCLLSTWDFRAIAAAMPAWRAIVAGTAFAQRIDQTGRRAALRLGQIGEAARDIDTIGDDIGALVLRGEVLDAQGCMDQARNAFEAAIRRDGTDPDARQSYGFHLLKAGRVRDGLASWSVADTLFGTYPLRRHRPHWSGESLGGRRLMVLFEHGLGDMIQVARFLPRLLDREPGATVMARLPAPLLGLFARTFPRVRFVSEDEREPDYDVFVPSMQLAAVLDAADLAPRSLYIDLGAPAPRPPGTRPRVGVCWRGHPRQYEFTRSIPLDLFAQLFAARDVDIVVLLHRPTAEETARLASEPNVSAPPIDDFIDLAALVASCDLVISVDTAVVHLAGAGGVPTLLMSRPDACWRWGAEGSSGPWYDSVEVLRHDGDMDWPRLLDEAGRRIAALARAPVAA
ncbi:MAG: glycosyltransferase family 9 protein [Janthinobacterium lividum]